MKYHYGDTVAIVSVYDGYRCATACVDPDSACRDHYEAENIAKRAETTVASCYIPPGIPRGPPVRGEPVAHAQSAARACTGPDCRFQPSLAGYDLGLREQLRHQL